ncbi:MAG: UTRA domain-containing protein, partial [Gammaproteobacteria bacterium]|nr:UTRA domain-containing protein [Gammaproteobacteria bacterium]
VYVQSITSVSELLQYPGDTRLMVTDTAEVIADEALAVALGVENGSVWTRISGRRVRSGAVLTLCHTDVYVLPAYAGVGELIGRDGKPVYSLIEQRYGEQVRDVQVEIGARAVDAQLAEALGVEPGSPALAIKRRYIGANGLFEVSVTTHPADRFTYALTLQRGWQPAVNVASAGERSRDSGD